MAASDVGVVSEVYDEIIFQEPTQLMRISLEMPRPLPTPYVFETDCVFFICFYHLLIFCLVNAKAAKTLEDINRAREKVNREIIELRDKLQTAKDTISKFKNEIVKAQTAAIKPA